MKRIDYLVVGHVCRDLVTDGSSTVGGTVSYSGLLAHSLGYETAVLTSTAPDYDMNEALPGLNVHNVLAEHSTTFSNIYTNEGRTQIIHCVANHLGSENVPEDWFNPRILHLGPLVNRVDPYMADSFPNSIIGMTPQGWMRRWQEDGRVYAKHWDLAEVILPKATAVIISQEDLLDDEMLVQFRKWSKLLVMTRGWGGCTIFQGDDMCHIPAPEVEEIEPTGAGDIFATAFLLQYLEADGDACEAGRFANHVASQSVTQIGLDAKLAKIKDSLEES
ncbi:MAG: PfkB family carbohydrate kinase [Chloroflexota bacterium]